MKKRRFLPALVAFIVMVLSLSAITPANALSNNSEEGKTSSATENLDQTEQADPVPDSVPTPIPAPENGENSTTQPNEELSTNPQEVGTSLPGIDFLNPHKDLQGIPYRDTTKAASFVRYEINSSQATGEVSEQTGTVGETVTLQQNNFVWDGYRFIGWNTSPDGNAIGYVPGQPYTLVEGGTILYAMWEKYDAAVVYFGAGGIHVDGKTVVVWGMNNQRVTICENAYERKGYSFVKWNTERDGSGTDFFPGDIYQLPPYSVTSLWAQWSADPAAIMYDGNGSTGGSMPDTEGVTGETVFVYENGYDREGYTFKSWNTEADGSGDWYYPFDSLELPAGGLTLYAMWAPAPASVMYDGNGSTGGSTPETTGTTNETVTISENGFERVGYTFKSWNTFADGSGIDYLPGESFELPIGTSTLYARWSADPASIVYDGNGSDSGSVADTTGVTDESVTVRANGFGRKDYTFNSWNTEADGSGIRYQAGDSYELPAGVSTLYAQWTKNSVEVPPSETTPDAQPPKVKPSDTVSQSQPSAVTSQPLDKALAQTGADVSVIAGVAALIGGLGIAAMKIARRRSSAK